MSSENTETAVAKPSTDTEVAKPSTDTEVAKPSTDTPKEAPSPPKDAPRSPPREGSRAPPNNIFIGKKPLMTYATSALIQLTQSDNIVLKARGMVISRAVDVAEVLTKRLGNNNYEVRKIGIDTERVGEGEDARNVSTIEIIIAKK